MPPGNEGIDIALGMRLCHSRMQLVQIFPREGQEMVFEAHERAFRFFGGVGQRGIYDNMKTAVSTVFVGKKRGRDVLAGIVHGGRASLAVGLSAAAICVIAGIAVGAAAGFYGGLLYEALMRLTEFFQVLPALLFAMTLVSLFGPDLVTFAVAIGAVSWPPVAHLTRAEFLRIRQLDYVSASRAIGAPDRRLIWRVILPGALPSLVVAATLAVGAAILFEAGLSFLGLGDPDTMSWGLMIRANRDFVLEAWWAVTLPGLAIFVTVLGVSLIGDGLTDALDPKRKGR